MGGLGSGNWYRWQERKSTVEESLGEAMQDFHGTHRQDGKPVGCDDEPAAVK